MAAPARPVKAACGLAGLPCIKAAMTKHTNDGAKDPKKERLAAALRTNLRRRKAQERAQGDKPVPPPPTDD